MDPILIELKACLKELAQLPKQAPNLSKVFNKEQLALIREVKTLIENEQLTKGELVSSKQQEIPTAENEEKASLENEQLTKGEIIFKINSLDGPTFNVKDVDITKEETETHTIYKVYRTITFFPRFKNGTRIAYTNVHKTYNELFPDGESYSSFPILPEEAHKTILKLSKKLSEKEYEDIDDPIGNIEAFWVEWLIPKGKAISFTIGDDVKILGPGETFTYTSILKFEGRKYDKVVNQIEFEYNDLRHIAAAIMRNPNVTVDIRGYVLMGVSENWDDKVFETDLTYSELAFKRAELTKKQLLNLLKDWGTEIDSNRITFGRGNTKAVRDGKGQVVEFTLKNN